MEKDEFLKKLVDEGMLIYGATWLENFKRLQELKKYKEMWGELEEMFTPGKVFYICKNKNFQEHTQKIMDLKYIIDELKQEYFPKQRYFPLKFNEELELTKAFDSLFKTIIELRKLVDV